MIQDIIIFSIATHLVWMIQDSQSEPLNFGTLFNQTDQQSRLKLSQPDEHVNPMD